LTNGNQKLLWVDDDSRDRFFYEIDCLQEHGWKVEWAEDGEEAIVRLSTERFGAILLDQSFKLRVSDAAEDVWGGCRVLYWLQGKEQPPEAPLDLAWQESTKARKAVGANKRALALIISAFFDEQVDAALGRLRPVPDLLVKPIDEHRLLSKLDLATK
jgi:CheY-like chemotaxis protein